MPVLLVTCLKPMLGLADCISEMLMAEQMAEQFIK